MRMVYTTPRAENADRVVQIFLDHEIAARVTNDGGWRGRNHRRFSYFNTHKNRDAWPQVWVVRSDDMPRARELLREMGIEPAIRYQEDLHNARTQEPDTPTAKRRKLVTRIRRTLLAIIVVMALLTLLHIFG